MPQNKFQIQTLVTHRSDQYIVKPLFSNHPVGRSPLFSNAEKQFIKNLRLVLSQTNFSNAFNLHLQWLFFRPKVKLASVNLKFTVDRQYIDQRFTYIWYEVKGLIVVVLPDFDHHQFIANEQMSIIEQIQLVVMQLIKKHKKALERNELFDIKPYTAPKNRFIHDVELSLDIPNPPFSFEQNNFDNWFANLMPQSDFDGKVEIGKVGQELNDLYPRELKRAYERDQFAERLKNQIFNGNRTPVALVGKRGAGKTTIIHEVLYRYLAETNSNQYEQQKIWKINPNRIISGMSIIGYWQKRFEAIIEYAQTRLIKQNKKLTTTDHLLFDNPVAMLRIGNTGQNAMSLTNVLQSYLEKRQVGVLLLATPEEWQIMQEKNRRFADTFQIVRLPELDYRAAAKAVIQQKRHLETKHFCQFSIAAIDHLFELQRSFLHQQALPGSVMKIMNQLATRYQNRKIHEDDVRDNFEAFSGINEKIFDGSYALEPGEVETAIGESLVGQPAAVTAVADTIHIVKAKLTNPRKPLSSFIFIGPTGVGKTQAAKALSTYLTGSEFQLIRFDMNEYIGGDAVDRLIGNYHHPEGLLTGKIRHNPFGILLLDEIEKAHPNVHDLLLQVLDDGRLTDSLGRVVDFTNVIIIMTSNVGAREASVQLGYHTATRSESAIYATALKKSFRPEFVNRIDKVVIFNPLSFEHILGIARLQIKELLSRDGFVRRNTILNISQEALSWVARRGYDSKMGGRALKRQIERDLTMLSAEQLIATRTDMPILFTIDIDGANNRLVPNIKPLSFTKSLPNSWMPKFPEAKAAKGYFKRQLNRLHKLEKYIREKDEEEGNIGIMIGGAIPGNPSDWMYYNFKNNLLEIKERLTNFSLGYDHDIFISNSLPAFRFKRPMLNNDKASSSLDGQIFEKETLEELSENYRHATTLFDKTQTDMFNALIDVDWLDSTLDFALDDEIDHLVISFKSYIDGLGQYEIHFLLNAYDTLFTHLELNPTVDKKAQTINVSGYGLSDLLAHEHGITLFYKMHSNPIPIITEIALDNNGEHTPLSTTSPNIIRYFDLQGTMTDLRTGMICVSHLNVEEFRLLVWSGMKQHVAVG